MLLLRTADQLVQPSRDLGELLLGLGRSDALRRNGLVQVGLERLDEGPLQPVGRLPVSRRDLGQRLPGLQICCESLRRDADITRGRMQQPRFPRLSRDLPDLRIDDPVDELRSPLELGLLLSAGRLPRTDSRIELRLDRSEHRCLEPVDSLAVSSRNLRKRLPGPRVLDDVSLANPDVLHSRLQKQSVPVPLTGNCGTSPSSTNKHRSSSDSRERL